MRLTRFNPETGQYEYKEPAKTQAEFTAQRKAVIQRLGEIEDKIEQGDVVEVVRCKDCKRCKIEPLTKRKGEESIDYYICPVLEKRVESDFYCACGERRDG